MIVPVAAEKFRESPEMVMAKLAVALARPERVKFPSWKADPPLLMLEVCVLPDVLVLVNAVVVFAKNWIVLRLLLWGMMPPLLLVQVPRLLEPLVNQSSGEVGVAPLTLELAQV